MMAVFLRYMYSELQSICVVLALPLEITVLNYIVPVSTICVHFIWVYMIVLGMCIAETSDQCL